MGGLGEKRVGQRDWYGLNLGSSRGWRNVPLLALGLLLACQRQPSMPDPAVGSPGLGAPVIASEFPTTALPTPAEPKELDPGTGLIIDDGYLLVRNNCGTCHSFQLVKNKRASREGWLATIRWMQQTQGLWDLGENEKPILNYLAQNYAPADTGRRKQLTDIKWYKLEEEQP